MSMTWRTVALPKAVPSSSGTIEDTSAPSSSAPSATRISASSPVNDLVIDIAACLPPSSRQPEYRS